MQRALTALRPRGARARSSNRPRNPCRARPAIPTFHVPILSADLYALTLVLLLSLPRLYGKVQVLRFADSSFLGNGCTASIGTWMDVYLRGDHEFTFDLD